MSRYSFSYENFLNEFVSKEFAESYKKNSHVKELTNKVILNFPDNIGEDNISKELHITKRWLQKSCIKTFGITYKRFIRVLRIYAALKLLYETKFDNLDIAFNLNYTEESNMARDFRIELHICPNEARRRLAVMNPKQLFDNLWQRQALPKNKSNSLIVRFLI